MSKREKQLSSVLVESVRFAATLFEEELITKGQRDQLDNIFSKALNKLERKFRDKK